ncbi:MAG TPA: J domain-containing protein [Opitutaceae bacterium]|nr:J domain-containing protein [Opitutaceae bacterium]
MPKIRTHYDTLKVPRDASVRVIHAAYRSLARKYHPDRRGDSPESQAAMQALNAAYEALSNPLTRAEHDRWIEAELGAESSTAPRFDVESDAPVFPDAADDTPRNPPEPAGVAHAVLRALLAVCYLAIAGSLIYIPGARLIGVLMLSVVWLYYRNHHRDSR